MRASALAAVVLLTACGHEGAFAPRRPEARGPFGNALPRRLTFDIHDDAMPSVRGNLLLYSSQGETDTSQYTGVPREFCISMMPLDGGTRTTMCPHDWLRFDTLVDTWFEPSLSPDGSRLAFVWQRAYDFSVLGYRDAYLVVTGRAYPADTTQTRVMVQYAEAGTNPRRADIGTRITWVGNDTLRFLATREVIIKVKGGGSDRVTDTLMTSLAVMELSLSSGQTRVVPGSDSTIAYANAPGGGIWIVREGDATLLAHLDPASGARTPVGRFSLPVTDLIEVNGAAVAALDSGRTIEQLDVNGATTPLPLFTNRVVRIASAGGTRFVAEVEQAAQLFGAPTDLWLIDVANP